MYGPLVAHTLHTAPVIALTGAFGGGLSTAARRLESEHGFQRVSLALEIRKEWERRYGDQTPLRSDLQRLGDELRSQEGNGTLVLRAGRDQFEVGTGESIVIESVKNVGEIQALRQIFGYRLLVVAVLSDYATRQTRAIHAYERGGLNEGHLWEDDQRDRNEEIAYGQQVELCIDLADVILSNDADRAHADFDKRIDELVGLVTRSRPRSLTQTEIYMHAAYSIARSSKCMKRHVGAVLVDDLGQVIAAGYNENPTGTKPCAEELAYDYQCHRDIVRNAHFEMLARRGGRCPVCTAVLPLMKGPPWRCPRCLSEGRKTNLEQFYYPDRAMSFCTAIHAEMRAILTAGRRTRGATLYTTTFPCMQCAEKITEGGVKEVYFTEAYPDKFSMGRLDIAGIDVHQFEGVRSAAVERLFPNPWVPLV